MGRFTLASLLIFVGLIAVGLAALRDASEWTARTTFTVTLAVLAIGLVGAIVRRRRAAWVGFSVLGWGYFLAAFAPGLKDEIAPFLLTSPALEAIFERLHHVPPLPPELGDGLDNVHGFPYTKIVNGLQFSLSPEEVQLVQGHQKRVRAHHQRMFGLTDEFRRSRRIGHSLLCLIAGLVGALAGRLLARGGAPAETEMG